MLLVKNSPIAPLRFYMWRHILLYIEHRQRGNSQLSLVLIYSDSGEMIMALKDLLASSLVIALGVLLVIQLGALWMYGGLFIYESNKVILVLETVLGITIIAFGVKRLVSSANGR